MSTTKEETLEVTKNIVIDAPPEVVFKAITSKSVNKLVPRSSHFGDQEFEKR